MNLLDRLKEINCAEALQQLLDTHSCEPNVDTSSVLDIEALQDLLENEKSMASFLQIAERGQQDMQNLPRILVIALCILQQPSSSLSDRIYGLRLGWTVSSASGAAARGCCNYSVVERLLAQTLRSIGEAKGFKGASSSDCKDDDVPADEADEEEEATRRSRGKQQSSVKAPQLRALASALWAGLGALRHVSDEHLHTQFVEALCLAYVTLRLLDKSAAGAQQSGLILQTLREYVRQGAQGVLVLHRALLPVLANTAPKTHVLAVEGAGKNAKGAAALVKDIYKEMIPTLFSEQVLAFVSAPLVPPTPAGSSVSPATPATARSLQATATPATVAATPQPGAPSAATPHGFSLSASCVLGLLERVCLSPAPALASQRAASAECVAEIVGYMLRGSSSPEAADAAAHFLHSFLRKLLVSAKPAHRMTALDIFSPLLALPMGERPQEHEELLAACVERCEDAHPLVRLKAVQLLHALLHVEQHSQQPQAPPALVAFAEGRRMVRGRGLRALLQHLLLHEQRAAVQTRLLACLGQLLAVASQPPSLEDLRVLQGFVAGPAGLSLSVRKQAAASLHDAAMRMLGQTQTLVQGAQVAGLYLQALLPLLGDSEASLVAKATGCLKTALLDALLVQEAAGAQERGWLLLRAAAETGLLPLLKALVAQLLSAGFLLVSAPAARSGAPHVRAQDAYPLQELLHVCREGVRSGRAEAYALLESVLSAPLAPSAVSAAQNVSSSSSSSSATIGELLQRGGGVDFLLDALQAGASSAGLVAEDVLRALRILAKVPQTVPPSRRAALHSLLDAILDASQPAQPSSAELLGVAAALKFELLQLVGGAWAQAAADWAGRVLPPCLSLLRQYILPDSVSSSSPAPSAERACGALLLLGAVALLGFRADEVEGSVAAVSAVGAGGELFVVHVPERSYFRFGLAASSLQLVALLMGPQLPGQRTTPARVRSLAFLCMGRLCLRDQQLARKTLPLLLRELQAADAWGSADAGAGAGLWNVSDIVQADGTSSFCDVTMSAAYADSALQDEALPASLSEERENVRSNALLILGDLSVRYTQLVSPHLAVLNALLEDPSRALRRTALLTLSALCAQDYVKLKPDLLLRVLRLVGEGLAAQDCEASMLAQMAREVVERVVRVKNANLLQGIFVEAFVVFAGCSEHASFRMLYPSAGNCAGPAPPAPLSAEQRMHVFEYLYLLSPVEARLGHVCRLVGELLGGVVDHPAALRGAGMEALLADVFRFLQSPLLKIKATGKAGVAAGAEDEDAAEDAAAEGREAGGVASKLPALEAARNKVLRALSQQQLLSQTLPVLVSLKHVLEQQRSPLQGALMQLLVHLVKTHRQEAEQALAYDPSLQAEVLYDLKQFERQQQQQQQAAMLVATARKKGRTPSKSPASATPLPPLRGDAGKLLLSVRKSTGARSNGGSSRAQAEAEDDEDPMLRLTQDYAYHNTAASDALSAEPASSNRRRSWGVVVSLSSDDATEEAAENRMPPPANVNVSFSLSDAGEAGAGAGWRGKRKAAGMPAPPALLAVLGTAGDAATEELVAAEDTVDVMEGDRKRRGKRAVATNSLLL